MAASEIDSAHLEELLAALRPPALPQQSLERKNVALFKLTTWKRSYVAPILAALSLRPEFHANGIRFDWLQRLVIAYANGKRKPSNGEIAAALNGGLQAANVSRQEDPIEDLLCDLIATPLGNFRIVQGQVESAAAYTQTLLDALTSLPTKSGNVALHPVLALLQLSDAIAQRAQIDRSTMSGGQPGATLGIPSDALLARAAHNVTFHDRELVSLGIPFDTLSIFYLQPHEFAAVADKAPGDSALDVRPLLRDGEKTIVLAPSAISTAVRARIVQIARETHQLESLAEQLLKIQEDFSEQTDFWPVSNLGLGNTFQSGMRAVVHEYSEGRFLQVIQLPVQFNDFPRLGFGSTRTLLKDQTQFIEGNVATFWQRLANAPLLRDAVTVLLMSGWGLPTAFAPNIDAAAAPEEWLWIPVGFAEAAVMGCCEDGKFRDIVRLTSQRRRLEAEGFSFQNLNGLLNFFGFWKDTNGNLIPEHIKDITLPFNLVTPTDCLLEPRREAAIRRDFRTLFAPNDLAKRVQRMKWGDDIPLLPIYGSLDDLAARQLVGAVRNSSHTWWVECISADGEMTEWRYGIFDALLHWLAAMSVKGGETLPIALSHGPASIRLRPPASQPRNEHFDDPPKRDALPETITVTTENGAFVVTVDVAWMLYLADHQNIAELELAAAALHALVASNGGSVSRDDARDLVARTIASNDWRWIHATRSQSPQELLASYSLVPEFREVSFSAASLAKCGSVWALRDREQGMEINGEEACQEFLASYRDHILSEVIAFIRDCNRSALVLKAATAYQSARLEQAQWRRSIRALRAIDGIAADERAFTRQYQINAVQRAAKSVCEIAAVEGRAEGGELPDDVELQELFAKIMLLLGNGERFASIRVGLAQPTLRLSPAGDLLSDRGPFDAVIRPAVEWSNRQHLDDAADHYATRRTTSDSKKPEWDAEFRDAIESEYGVSPEAFIELSFVLTREAKARAENAFIVRRSALAESLRANRQYGHDAARLLDRFTLGNRSGWHDRPEGLVEADFDLCKFDRPYSLISRPLLALDASHDPFVLVCPLFVSDASMYSLMGLRLGTLQGRFWSSDAARGFAGSRANELGDEFESTVADALERRGLEVWKRCSLGWALNMKVNSQLGDIDILALNRAANRLWIVEAKNLRFCRSEFEVASRISEYRGRTITDSKGREYPDKMLRHIRRVQFLREHRGALCGRLELPQAPEVHGLLLVDSPQPMNFRMLENLEDGGNTFLQSISEFAF
jgi:hypothetical protein